MKKSLLSLFVAAVLTAGLFTGCAFFHTDSIAGYELVLEKQSFYIGFVTETEVSYSHYIFSSLVQSESHYRGTYEGDPINNGTIVIHFTEKYDDTVKYYVPCDYTTTLKLTDGILKTDELPDYTLNVSLPIQK